MVMFANLLKFANENWWNEQCYE